VHPVAQALLDLPEWQGFGKDERAFLEKVLSLQSADEFGEIDLDALVLLRRELIRVDKDGPSIDRIKQAVASLPPSPGRIAFI